MKTLKSFSILAVISILISSPAFASHVPDQSMLPVTNKDCISNVASADLVGIESFVVLEDEPVYDPVYTINKSINKITLKIYNSAGELIKTKDIPMHEFINKAQWEKQLPENSMFLMFHDNAAYYIQQ